MKLELILRTYVNIYKKKFNIYIFIYIFISFLFTATLFYLDDDKDGKFKLQNFENLSTLIQNKEKVYKRYEFYSQLQAHFTLLMWKVKFKLIKKDGIKYMKN